MNGYTALITGGNKGIGANLANRLLIEGYKVVSMSRNTPEATNKNLFSIEVDLLDDIAVKSAAKEVAKIHNVTHLIHNAGLIWPNLIEETKASDISGLAQLHLGSALTLLKAVLPRMKKTGLATLFLMGRVLPLVFLLGLPIVPRKQVSLVWLAPGRWSWHPMVSQLMLLHPVLYRPIISGI